MRPACLLGTKKISKKQHRKSEKANAGRSYSSWQTHKPQATVTTSQKKATMSYLLLLLAASSTPGTNAFSASAATSQFDRFRAECPASSASVALFDPALAKDVQSSEADDAAFVAVYRSSNNLPSVILKDEFLNSMRIATTIDPEGIETKDAAAGGEAPSVGKGVEAQTPVAVARLRPSPDFEGSYVIDDLRCSLKKEDTSEDCDGGSEHTEALGVCIDELILHRLKLSKEQAGNADASFDGTVRAKATLVSAPLLADRGFQEIEAFPLPQDMSTHVSSLDASMNAYADRVVGAGAKNVGARERALKILSLMGRLNREQEKKATKKRLEDAAPDDDEGEGYDPWANVKLPGQWKS